MKCIDEEIPFEIPATWEWCRVGYIFSHCTGKALNGTNRKGNLYTYITTSNLYWDRFELSSLKEMYFTEEELGKCTVTKGDLLVCEGGDIGRSAIWNYNYDVRIQNHIHKMRSYSPLCTRFFYYVMYLYKSIGYIGGKGIGIQGLSSGALHNILIPMPSIDEQERIVSQIEAIMLIAAKYEKSQEELNQLNDSIHNRLRKSILQEAIQGRLVPQIAEEGTAQELLEQIRQEKLRLVEDGKLKKSALADSVIYKGDDNKYYEQIGSKVVDITGDIPFEIPPTWMWCRFGTIVKMRIGKTPPRGEQVYWSNGKHNWVSISDMVEGGTIKAVKEKVSDIAVNEIFKCYPTPKGSLLMSFKLTVGRTSILGVDAYHNEAIITIVPYADVNNIFRDYLFYILPTISNSGDSKDAIKGKTLNNKSLNNLLIPLPPLLEQKRIVTKIELVNSKIKG